MAMKFVILGFDGPEGQALRKIHRSTHIQRIERWNSRHRVILAGPLTDNAGSLIILEADSRQEVEELSEKIPTPHLEYSVGLRSIRSSKSFLLSKASRIFPDAASPYGAAALFTESYLHHACPSTSVQT